MKHNHDLWTCSVCEELFKDMDKPFTSIEEKINCGDCQQPTVTTTYHTKDCPRVEDMPVKECKHDYSRLFTRDEQCVKCNEPKQAPSLPEKLELEYSIDVYDVARLTNRLISYLEAIKK